MDLPVSMTSRITARRNRGAASATSWKARSPSSSSPSAHSPAEDSEVSLGSRCGGRGELRVKARSQNVSSRLRMLSFLPKGTSPSGHRSAFTYLFTEGL